MGERRAERTGEETGRTERRTSNGLTECNWARGHPPGIYFINLIKEKVQH